MMNRRDRAERAVGSAATGPLLLVSAALAFARPAAAQTSASEAVSSAEDEEGAASTDTEAQDEGRRTDQSPERKSEKLSDRIKSVQRKVFLKRRRF
ncbi:MAG: hypothetical protein AAF449_23785, partial [Myxococcota bacterium]